MKTISEYLTQTKEERQKHLRLDEDCIERGGQSMYLKGLLAHLHNTTIPTGHEAHVCHACHNAICSNPNHVYWGTPKENAADHIANGGKTIWENMVNKYGEDGARAMQGRSKKLASKAGQGNKGKPKSEEHKRKIREAIQRKHAEGDYWTNTPGRKKK